MTILIISSEVHVGPMYCTLLDNVLIRFRLVIVGAYLKQSWSYFPKLQPTVDTAVAVYFIYYINKKNHVKRVINKWNKEAKIKKKLLRNQKKNLFKWLTALSASYNQLSARKPVAVWCIKYISAFCTLITCYVIQTSVTVAGLRRLCTEHGQSISQSV